MGKTGASGSYGSTGTAVVVKQTEYATELECEKEGDEAMRKFRHVWCAKKNNGNLAQFPEFTGGVRPQTVPEVIKAACAEHSSSEFMGTRDIIEAQYPRALQQASRTATSLSTTHTTVLTSCCLRNLIVACMTTTEPKRMYWVKSGVRYETYGQVFEKMQNTAKGLLGLAGVTDIAKAAYEKRRLKQVQDGDEVVVALLAETAAEWQIAAQVRPEQAALLYFVWRVYSPGCPRGCQVGG